MRVSLALALSVALWALMVELTVGLTRVAGTAGWLLPIGEMPPLFALHAPETGHQVDGERIRQRGMDVFGLNQPCLHAKLEHWRCGGAAKGALAELTSRPFLECTEADQHRDGMVKACTFEEGIDFSRRIAPRPGVGSRTLQIAP